MWRVEKGDREREETRVEKGQQQEIENYKKESVREESSIHSYYSESPEHWSIRTKHNLYDKR